MRPVVASLRLALFVLALCACDHRVAGTTDETETGKPLAGRVVDSSGRGLPAVVVAVRDSGLTVVGTVLADSHGVWSVPGSWHAQGVVARWSAERNLVAWGDSGDLVLRAAARIWGRVLSDIPSNGCRVPGTLIGALPAANGLWSIPNMPIGVAPRLECGRPDAPPVRQVVGSLRPDQDTSVGELLLPGPAWGGRKLVTWTVHGYKPDTSVTGRCVLRFPASDSSGLAISTLKVAQESAKPGVRVQPEGGASQVIGPGLWGQFMSTSDLDGDGFLTLIVDPLDTTAPQPIQMDLIP